MSGTSDAVAALVSSVEYMAEPNNESARQENRAFLLPDRRSYRLWRQAGVKANVELVATWRQTGIRSELALEAEHAGPLVLVGGVPIGVGNFRLDQQVS